jgi:hypothetical protein
LGWSGAYPQDIAGTKTRVVGRESADLGRDIVELIEALCRTIRI